VKTNLSFLLSLATLGLLGVTAGGCGTDPAPTTVVCTDFRAGADLSESTFGVTGDLGRSYGAFAQAAGDLSAVANEMLRDVGASCQGLAVELGADRDDPRTKGKLEPEEVREWCKIAAERFRAVRPELAKANFAVKIVTPKCTVDTSFQIECEKKCVADATCVEAPTVDRCPEGAREGICPGLCTGTCTGSETAPATCDGKCDGTCFGTCGEGEDAVDCEGTGCTCTDHCVGSCTAACTMPSEGARCDAPCAGSCSEPMVAETCTKALAAPACKGDSDCQKSCGTSSAARAVCPAGSLAVVIDDEARKSPRLAAVIGALERNLPAIFLAARGRAQVLADSASDLLDHAGRILNRSEELGPMGAACGMLIGQTGSEARKNLNAALGGSKDVANAVSGDDVAPPTTDD